MQKDVRDPQAFRKNIRNLFQEKHDALVKEREREREREDAGVGGGGVLFAFYLERGVFNACIQEALRCDVIRQWANRLFVEMYMNKTKSVYLNLTLECILQFRRRPHKIAFLSHQELDPKRWKPLIDAKSMRDKHKYEGRLMVGTNMFTCRKCKTSNCTFYLQQVRSADEPMTIFVSCLDCGKQWRT